MPMESFLQFLHYDLVTPDGKITQLKTLSDREAEAIVFIEKISPDFVGYSIDLDHVFFNIKSTLAQVGVDGIGQEYYLDPKNSCAQVKVLLKSIDPLGIEMLKLIRPGLSVGKLFAADERRRVRNPDYLSRMFGRSDRWGRPLLSLGGMHGSDDLILDKVEGRTIAYLALQTGRLVYEESIFGFLPTLAKALISGFSMRNIVGLHQIWKSHLPRNANKNELLLVKTLPLHIRTAYARVVPELLAKGYHHTTACVLQPDTRASGDVYELYGLSKRELTDIPLEFYTLEPYREHVFFSDRDQLQNSLDEKEILFSAFKTAPQSPDLRVAVFVVKGEQLLNLKEDDWIAREHRTHEFPGIQHGTRQAIMVERYIDQQPSFPFLKNIDIGNITSEGVLFTRYFPSPLMKRLLLSDQVQRFLKGIYFQIASQTYQNFFSAEDRALLHDLEKFAIPVYWVDEESKQILKYVQKPDHDSGLFVPLKSVQTFLNATLFGIYGSNLLEGVFEDEIRVLLQGILNLKQKVTHDLLNSTIPLALVTGGGPGAMEVGNRVAKELGILSCANVVDFRNRNGSVIPEQKINPFIDAKMTYRLDKLVERQAEFNLDFPIFLAGGIGTDFELSLEEVRRKVGAVRATPVLLFGTPEYWGDKITHRFKCNRKSGTIKGSEWLSNCFYCVQSAEEGIHVYEKYFTGTLPIGKDFPVYDDGFVIAKSLFKS